MEFILCNDCMDLDRYLISIQYSSLSYKEEIDLNIFLKMLWKNSYDCVNMIQSYFYI